MAVHHAPTNNKRIMKHKEECVATPLLHIARAKLDLRVFLSAAPVNFANAQVRNTWGMPIGKLRMLVDPVTGVDLFPISFSFLVIFPG